MTEQEAVADALHIAGMGALTHPSSRSGDEWKEYRLKIADELIRQGIGVIDKCEVTT